MCVHNCVQMSSESGPCGGEGVRGEGGEDRGDLAKIGRGERKLPDIVKSMVMKTNTP